MESKLKTWHRLRSTELFRSRWMSLRKDECELPSGRIIDDYFVLEIPDGAVVVAITEKRELVLVRQYKHGAGQFVLELPAGIVESNEDPATTIARELKEETGYVASQVEYVTTLATKPARMTANTHVFFSNSIKLKEKIDINDSEVIETVLLPISEIAEYIKSGKITIETTLAALLVVWDRWNY